MTKTGGGGGGEEREVVSWLVSGRAGRQVGRLMAFGKQTPCLKVHYSNYPILQHAPGPPAPSESR